MTAGGDPPPVVPGHDGGRWAPVAVQTAIAWEVGHFAENLVVDESGVLFVTLHSHRRIERWDPAVRRPEVFAEFPAPVTGLAPGGAGRLWVSGGELGRSPGWVWRVGAGGEVEPWVQIDEASFLNGCAALPDGGELLVCDSIAGAVYAVDRVQRRWRTWLADDRLTSDNPQVPGANGIKVHAGAVWISVTARGTVLRAALHDDGTPGPVEVVAEGLIGDDFAFADSGAIYLATHPVHTVIRLDPDGHRRTLAGPEQGAAGATACAFGRAPQDDGVLYVTTSGGLMTPYQGAAQPARLLRLQVAERGAPIPY